MVRESLQERAAPAAGDAVGRHRGAMQGLPAYGCPSKGHLAAGSSSNSALRLRLSPPLPCQHGLCVRRKVPEGPQERTTARVLIPEAPSVGSHRGPGQATLMELLTVTRTHTQSRTLETSAPVTISKQAAGLASGTRNQGSGSRAALLGATLVPKLPSLTVVCVPLGTPAPALPGPWAAMPTPHGGWEVAPGPGLPENLISGGLLGFRRQKAVAQEDWQSPWEGHMERGVLQGTELKEQRVRTLLAWQRRA